MRARLTFRIAFEGKLDVADTLSRCKTEYIYSQKLAGLIKAEHIIPFEMHLPRKLKVELHTDYVVCQAATSTSEVHQRNVWPIFNGNLGLESITIG